MSSPSLNTLPSGRRASKTYKPAPPVTTPPPPKRLSLPTSPTQIHGGGNKTSFSSRASSTRLSTNPASLNSLTNSEQATQPSTALIASTSPPTSSSELAHTRPQCTPPPLPLRNVTLSKSSSTKTDMLAMMDVAPPLPPRKYSLLCPALPPRTYRTDGKQIASTMSDIKTEPGKPRALASPPTTQPLPSRSNERNLPRMSSSSSTSSMDSEQSSVSIVSTASSASTAPSIPEHSSSMKGSAPPVPNAKSAYIPELVKTLEAKQFSPAQKS